MSEPKDDLVERLRNECSYEFMGTEKQVRVDDPLCAEAADCIEAQAKGLEWYAEQVANCRKVTSEGDAARQELDRDGGKRAIAAMKGLNNE